MENEKKGISAEIEKLKKFLKGIGSSKKLAVFGDSVIRGVMTDKISGRYRPYKARFSDARERFGIDIENNAKIGYTSEQGLDQLKKLINKDNCPDFVLLEYGGNDCNFDWKSISDDPSGKHEPVISPDDFRRNYEQMIDYVRECGGSPVMMIPPPIDSEKFLDNICKRGGLEKENILSWLGDISMIYRWQEHYSSICNDVAVRRDCPVIDLRSVFIVRHDFKSLIGDDGIHPTAEGHAIIDEAVCAFFDNIIKEEK